MLLFNILSLSLISNIRTMDAMFYKKIDKTGRGVHLLSILRRAYISFNIIRASWYIHYNKKKKKRIINIVIFMSNYNIYILWERLYKGIQQYTYITSQINHSYNQY